MRDRVKALLRLKASDLSPHPGNWRTHGDEQRAAWQAMLGKIGFAGALLAYEEPASGRLTVIDGHLRLSEADPEDVLPVVLLDLTPQEADELLVTFDPLAQMAGADAEKLSNLLNEIEVESESLRKTLEKLAKVAAPPAQSSAEETEPGWMVVVTCDSEQQQADLLTEFHGRGLRCKALFI